MFIVLLKFSSNRASAEDFMEAHNDWIRKGFDEGAFLLVGSLQPGLGGAIVAQADSREALEARVGEDPFVVQDLVNPEILDIAPAKSDPRLDFLWK